VARLQLEVASHKATLVLSTQSGRQSAPALHVLFQTTWQLGRLSTQPKSAWVGPPALGASPPPSPAPMHPYPPSSSLLSDGDSGLRPSPSGRQSAARIPSYPPGIARGACSRSQARGPGASPLLRFGRMVIRGSAPRPPGGNPLRRFRPILPSHRFGRMVMAPKALPPLCTRRGRLPAPTWFLLCRSTWQRRKPSAPQKSASWPSAPCASWRGRLRRALR